MAFGQGNGGFTAEALALIARMSPTPNYTRKVVINQLVADLIAGNVWNDLDVLHVYAADASGNAVLNFKGSSYGATNSGATFTADRGFTGDAATAYLSMAYQPGNGQFGASDHSFGAWVRTAATINSTSAGANDGSYFARVHKSTAIDGTLTDVVSWGTETGLLAVSRQNGTDFTAYRNGASVVTDAAAFTNPAFSFRVLATNSSGTETEFSDAQVSAFFAGKGLDSTKMAALYTALARYMTSVGA